MAGRIPRQFIDELMLRSDIVEVIDARTPLKKAGKDYKGLCPFHQEKSPSFTVSADKQFYHCFGCGAHGTVIGFLMEYDRMSFVEAVEELARRAGMEIPREARFAEPESSTDLLELLREAMRFYRAQLREYQPAIEYLKRRGITGEVARDFELGYAPESWDSLVRALGNDERAREAMVRAGLAVKKEGGGYYDRFRGRVIFPIHDHRGRIVGFGGRVFDAVQGSTNVAGNRVSREAANAQPGKVAPGFERGMDSAAKMSEATKGGPKYLNSPETPLFHKGRELYGLFRARDAIRRVGRVLVVEGYMDVVALAQFGVEYAVATLGTATTRDHLERLFRHASEVVFCFDGDRAGREAAWRALETTLESLRDGLQASFLFLPEGEDPDTLIRKEGREAFEARRGQAAPLAEFLFQTLRGKVDLGRLDGRARLVELARPLLSKIRPGVLSQMMLEKLGQLAQLDIEKLNALLRGSAEASNPERRFAKGVPGPKVPPSLMRRAVALLLQYPALAPQVPSEMDFAALGQLAGADIFEAVLEMLRSQPSLSTGAILERFRDTEHQPVLEKLAVLSDLVAERDVVREFDDLMVQLAKESLRARVEWLRQKQDSTQDEKAELARLLAEKGKLRDIPRQ